MDFFVEGECWHGVGSETLSYKIFHEKSKQIEIESPMGNSKRKNERE